MSLRMGTVYAIRGMWIRRGIGWLLGIGCGALLIAVLWKPCLPFAAALLLACAVQKPYRRLLTAMAGMHRASAGDVMPAVRVPAGWRYAAATVLILCCIFVGGAVILIIGYLLLSELGRTVSWIGENGAVIGTWVGRMMDGILRFIDRLPVPQGIPDETLRVSITESVKAALPDLIGGLLGGISAKASAAVTATVSALPGLLLFFAVFLIAAVYMTLSYDAILTVVRKSLPQKWRDYTVHLKTAVGGTVHAVFRAYLILSAVTFVLLLLGLLLLGVERASGLAVIGMLIDILPVFGVGTLLIPWAIFSFFIGDAGRGVGLVVLYLVICFVRQALEPRLIGKTAGVHPLAVLFAMYTGGMLFGVVGMIVLPFLLTVVWRGYRMIGRDGRA